jgi:RNA-directed DNA polymerase
MKRYGNLFNKIYDFDNLISAHRNARRGKIHYRDVEMVDSDQKCYLENIQRTFIEKTYRTSEYKVFTKIDKKKEREIFALPYYPDRIIQWAIVQVLEPIWMRTFIKGTYSSLKHRGIHAALVDIKCDLRNIEDTRYCLKFDIKKFYPSVDHTILKHIIRKKIKDPDVMELLDEIINSTSGIPIGNYLSQFFGNLYLNDFDHWMKEENRCKYYYRYCDDIVVLNASKETLYNLFFEIKHYLYENLKLTVKENYQIFPTNVRGIDFIGYRCFYNYTLLRKSTVKNLKKKMIGLQKFETLTPRDQCSIGSYLGWVKWCDGNRLTNKYILPLLDKEIANGK